jgi:acetyl esterase/lipase
MKRGIMLWLAVVATAVWGQDEIGLWDGEPPYSKPNTLEERVEQAWGVPCLVDVTVPTLTVHPGRGEVAAQSVIIFPGGGYEKVSYQAEGHEIAAVLASQGITAAVLKYRLPLEAASDQPHLLPETDARRAILLMRSLAGTYGFDASRVGVMGFSAGGHLATTVSVLPGRDEQERPDFSLLLYPVTTLTHKQKWLEETLFHRSMTEGEQARYSLVDHVSSVTPPAFLAHAYDDDVVSIGESQAYAEALVAAGRDVEVHFFARGGHGFGAGRPEDGTGQWLALAADWIRRQ